MAEEYSSFDDYEFFEDKPITGIVHGDVNDNGHLKGISFIYGGENGPVHGEVSDVTTYIESDQFI